MTIRGLRAGVVYEDEKAVLMMSRISFKIIFGVICMLFLVGTPFFIAFLRYHRSQLLEILESSTTTMSRIMTHQLEVSVLERRDHQLDDIVTRLSDRDGVLQIMVISSDERVVASSDRSYIGRRLLRHEEPGCRDCHISFVLKDTIQLADARGRPFYRTVTVIQNRPACYSCHGSKSNINGIFVMDISQNILQSQYRSSLYRLAGMGAAMLVLTIIVLYVLLNHLVLRRLRGFAEAAEKIGKSEFGQVAVAGDDEFSQLAASFNLMSRRLESAMKEIRRGKDYLESIINNIDDEILVLNRDFVVVNANDAYQRNRRGPGHEPEDSQAHAETPTELDQHAAEACACQHTFMDGKIHKILQTTIRPDGKERFMEVYCSPLRDHSGEVKQVIEVRRDITERKLLEANLAHSERLITMGLLASGLSHEINNPLASILTFVEVLQRRIGEPRDTWPEGVKELGRHLSLIQREIERARNVTGRLLILAQRDESALTLVDLNESLRETVQLVNHEAFKRQIQIEMDLDSSMPTLLMSESQLRQVFLNLLLNGLQAGHPGGYLRCRSWHGPGRAYASLEDDGRGIEPMHLTKIFEPFFSSKAPGQGTGLGLFICKSIVSSWGGDISVESRMGQGTRFTLWIPVQS